MKKNRIVESKVSANRKQTKYSRHFQKYPDEDPIRLFKRASSYQERDDFRFVRDPLPFPRTPLVEWDYLSKQQIDLSTAMSEEFQIDVDNEFFIDIRRLATTLDHIGVLPNDIRNKKKMTYTFDSKENRLLCKLKFKHFEVFFSIEHPRRTTDGIQEKISCSIILPPAEQKEADMPNLGRDTHRRISILAAYILFKEGSEDINSPDNYAHTTSYLNSLLEKERHQFSRRSAE